MNAGQSSFRTSGMTTALIGGFRAVDWWLPMGIAVPILYVATVLVSSWIPRSRTILLTAATEHQIEARVEARRIEIQQLHYQEGM